MDFLLALVGTVLVAALVWSMARPITILEYQRGLRYHRGRFRSVLLPGRYWRVGWSSRIDPVDVRERVVTVAGQEVLSADGVSIKMSMTALFRVAQPERAVHQVESYADALYSELQLNLRALVGGLGIEDLLARRAELGARLTEQSSARCVAMGLSLERAEIKDIMFPGDLKKTFSQVASARQEGLAALERARGETAALRNLANAASMVEKSPALLKLRTLHTLSQSTGNTIHLDWTTDGPHGTAGDAGGPPRSS